MSIATFMLLSLAIVSPNKIPVFLGICISLTCLPVEHLLFFFDYVGVDVCNVQDRRACHFITWSSILYIVGDHFPF